jgi:serine-type D-Ala-D-Ala carboxypeptidase/endopeptidase (penicillin-binding protein 4)
VTTARRPRLAAAAAAPLLALALASCGSSSKGTAHATTHTPTAVSAPTTPSPQFVSAPRHAGSRTRDGLQALREQLAAVFSAPGSGAEVVDITSRERLYAHDAGIARPPASVEKLYTSVAALSVLGPDARFTTRVLATGSVSRRGVLDGSLYLVGGGDPTLGTPAFNQAWEDSEGASIDTLAARVRASGIRRVRGAVLGDESLFDSGRGGPATAQLPDIVDLGGELSALVVNHGETGPIRPHGHALGPAPFAAYTFAAALRGAGVRAHASPRVAHAPATARHVAAVRSPPLSTILKLMNVRSDDFYAEMLVKDLGVAVTGHGTFAAGVAQIAAVLARDGLHPHLIDGSGLSHLDLSTPSQVVDLLVDVWGTPMGRILRDSLAVAGRTGTLASRVTGSVAAGRCAGKTGSLEHVSNVAGWCREPGGHLIAFALFNDTTNVTRAHTLQDNAMISIARDDVTQP